MSLRLTSFAPVVQAILADHEDRRLPLIQNGRCEEAALARILDVSATSLFPSARFADEARSGLLLLLDCWGESHRISQDLHTSEGSYWHGIAHRMEPDYFNAGYWFRKVGTHPIYPEILKAASLIVESDGVKTWRLKSRWDPLQFVEWCQEASGLPGTPKEKAALGIQRAEWELLLEWCGAAS